MRTHLTFAVLAASLVFSPSIRADENELFSEVAMEFVYAKSDQNDSDQVDTSEAELLPTRVTGSTSLVTLLKSAGFEPKKLDSRRVSLEIRSAAWKLRAEITSDVVADRLTVDMPLVKVADEAAVDPAKLLRLLTAGAGDGDVFFSYDRTDGMITLRSVMPNRGLTSEKIKQQLSDLTGVAQQYEDAWSELEKPAKTATTKPKTAETSTTAAAPKKTDPATPKLTLAGTWSAALGAGEAFAIQFNKDATFKLVHVKSGKSVSSTGKAARSGNQLTLNGNDGTKIVGTVTQKTNDAFQLSLSGTTLNFKKAK